MTDVYQTPDPLVWIIVIPLAVVYWAAVIRWWRRLETRDLLIGLRPTNDQLADDAAELAEQMTAAANARGHR